MGIWLDHTFGRFGDFDSSYKEIFKDYTFLSELKHKKWAIAALLNTSYDFPGLLFEQTNLLIAVDGTVDNLSALANELSCEVSIGEVIINLYRQKGSDGLLRLKGTASVILYDADTGTSLLYRCFFKGFPLYFVSKNNRLTVSTNPVMILHRNDVSDRLDDARMADLFSINLTRQTISVFSEISEVAQGELIVISSQGVERKKRSLQEIFSSSEFSQKEHTVETYRAMLEAATDRTIQPNENYGIMLSSGMDSSSIAVLAAKKLHTQGRELRAYSWMLPDDEQGDESEKIKELCRANAIPLTLFNGENFGSFDFLDRLYLYPESPQANLFWPVNQETHRLASRDGITKIYNGGYADMLFPARGNSLYETLRDKRFDLFGSILVDSFSRYGWRTFQRSPEIRKFIKGLLPIRQKNNLPEHEWLTNHIQQAKEREEEYTIDPNFEDFKYALSPLFTSTEGTDRYEGVLNGIEKIIVHRDIQLLHYSLGFPAYMTYRYGMTKYFAREAMKGLLPESIRTQPRAGKLLPFVIRSFKRNRSQIQQMLFDDRGSWNDYVREKWMQQKLSSNADLTPLDLRIIWYSLNMAPWQKAIKPGGSLYEV